MEEALAKDESGDAPQSSKAAQPRKQKGAHLPPVGRCLPVSRLRLCVFCTVALKYEPTIQ
jgi:hypothetical protein